MLKELHHGKIGPNVRSLWKNVYFTSFLSSLILIALIVALAGSKWGEPAGVILLPGAFIAALVFPEGAESDAGGLFIILAGAMDVVLLALLLVLVPKLTRRKHSSA